MVAPNPEAHVAPDPAPDPVRAGRSTLIPLFRRLANAAKLQKQILTLQAKILAKKLVLSAILSAGIMLLGLVGLVFLYIFTFKLLTDIANIPAVWVWLIFAGCHILAASIMALIVANLWREPKPNPGSATGRSSAAKDDRSASQEAHP